MSDKQFREPFFPPDTDSFLKEKLWSINEAMYVLAGWPNENLFLTTLSPLPENIKEHRSSFYLPLFSEPFDPHKVSTTHAEVFEEMEKAIKNREIWAIFECLHEGIVYLVRPYEVLLWALLKGYVLLDSLQIALNTFQMKDHKSSDALKRKVRIKVTGQYLLSIRTGLNVTKLCKDPLITRARVFKGDDKMNNICGDELRRDFQECSMISQSFKDEPRRKIPNIVRIPINELFEVKGKQGREKKILSERQERLYMPKPIPEVVEIAYDGTRRYNFPALKVAIETLVQARQSERFAQLLETSQDDFVRDFMQEKVIQLYLHEAPHMVVELVKLIIHKAWESIQEFHLLNEIANRFTPQGTLN